MQAKFWAIHFIGALPILFAGCAAISPAPSAARVDPTRVQITVLYDAFGKSSIAMQKDWGYAALVEYGGKRILFDTGNSPDILATNARAKGIDLAKLDFVIMSHRHGDHMGGMTHLLSVNPKVKIYAPKEGFGVYGADLPSTFYRKDASLPSEQRYYDGTPPAVMRFGAAWPGANFELFDKTAEIAPGIHLIALVSDKTGTLELRELSLAIDTSDGMVVIAGCSHPGIDKIVAAAVAINPRIHFIAGGFHLVTSSDQEIEATIASLRDSFKVAFVAPGHCTGEPTFTALKKAFGERYLYAGLGTTLSVGATPRATAGSGRHRSTAMDENDLENYRAAMPLTMRLRLLAQRGAAADAEQAHANERGR